MKIWMHDDSGDNIEKEIEVPDDWLEKYLSPENFNKWGTEHGGFSASEAIGRYILTYDKYKTTLTEVEIADLKKRFGY